MNPPAPAIVHRSSAATPAMTTVAGYLLTRLIEAVLGWTDAPPLLRDLARVLATSDSYSG
jgi:hypothetical protein